MTCCATAICVGLLRVSVSFPVCSEPRDEPCIADQSEGLASRLSERVQQAPVDPRWAAREDPARAHFRRLRAVSGLRECGSVQLCLADEQSSGVRALRDRQAVLHLRLVQSGQELWRAGEWGNGPE